MNITDIDELLELDEKEITITIKGSDCNIYYSDSSEQIDYLNQNIDLKDEQIMFLKGKIKEIQNIILAIISLQEKLEEATRKIDSMEKNLIEKRMIKIVLETSIEESTEIIKNIAPTYNYKLQDLYKKRIKHFKNSLYNNQQEIEEFETSLIALNEEKKKLHEDMINIKKIYI